MEFLSHTENALLEYSSGEKYEILLKAREIYFSQTGKVNEDDLDYESRMNCFNDWFLMQYKVLNSNLCIMEDYLQRHNIVYGLESENLEGSQLSYNHSIFEFLGVNRKKQQVVKDLLHRSKYILSLDQRNLSVIKGDIFIGRTIEIGEKTLLMSGLGPLPIEAKKILLKQCKKIRKLKDMTAEYSFLIQTESLNTKYTRFNHVDIKKIFIFED